MPFPEDALFEYVLIDLAEEMAARPVPRANPLPCDRWIARSCLQKACRRGEAELAQRALANLFEHDRRSVWRHLAIIAIEDVGVANVDVLARIIAAQRNRKWRQTAGGDWAVLAELVRQIAGSEHCQAACDLLLRAVNDPKLEGRRSLALEADAASLAQSLWDCSGDLESRAMIALALGGGLAEGQQFHDPFAVFDVLAEASRSTHIIATCRTSWKLTRNPMALLLPLVWELWSSISSYEVACDPMPQVDRISGVPGYSLDQFTRVGNAISRGWLTADEELRSILELAGVFPTAYVRTVGDLLFLSEGGLIATRITWPVGDQLRLPYRQLPAVASMGSALASTLTYLAENARQLTSLRREYFHPAQAQGSSEGVKPL